MFTIAYTAKAVADGTLTESEGLGRLVHLGHLKFDAYVWFRAARQGPAPGYGELTPLGSTAEPPPRPRIRTPQFSQGRHVGGNDPRRGAASSTDDGAPFVRRRGGRFESGATRPEIRS